MYEINLRGFAPSYYADKETALEKFAYVRQHFAGCSLRRVSYGKMLYKIYIRKV